MAGTTQTIQQGPIASRQRQLQARYNLTRSEALKDTFVAEIISNPALLNQIASVQGGSIPSPAGMSTEAAAGKLTGIGLKHVAGNEIVGPLVSKGVQAVAPSFAQSLGLAGGIPTGTSASFIGPPTAAMATGPPAPAAGGLAGMGASLATGAAIMGAFMTVVNWAANKFDPPKQRHIEAAAPGSAIRGSIARFLTGYGLDSGWVPKGKGSSLQGTAAFKRGGDISKVVRTVQKKYPGYSQWEYAEMLKMDNLRRFFPMISVGDAKESRRQELLNPKTDPQYTLPEQMKKLHGKHAQNAIWRNQQLLTNSNISAGLKTGKGSNPETRWQRRRTDMTMEGFFKNVYSSIEDDTFLDPFRTGTPEPEALTGGTASSMATGGMGRISSGSGMGASPRRSQHGMASQA